MCKRVLSLQSSVGLQLPGPEDHVLPAAGDRVHALAVGSGQSAVLRPHAGPNRRLSADAGAAHVESLCVSTRGTRVEMKILQIFIYSIY